MHKNTVKIKSMNYPLDPFTQARKTRPTLKRTYKLHVFIHTEQIFLHGGNFTPDVESLSAKIAPDCNLQCISMVSFSQAFFPGRLSDMTMFVQSANQNILFYFSNLI